MSVVDTTPTWYLVTGIGLSVAVIMVIGKLAERALTRLTNGGARG
jgi:hypothetical protein